MGCEFRTGDGQNKAVRVLDPHSASEVFSAEMGSGLQDTSSVGKDVKEEIKLQSQSRG